MIDANGVTPIPAPTNITVLKVKTSSLAAPNGPSNRNNGLPSGPLTLLISRVPSSSEANNPLIPLVHFPTHYEYVKIISYVDDIQYIL